MRILLVDDDPLILQSLREALEGDRHLVSAAEGGQAGIDAFQLADPRGAPFDAVITDLADLTGTDRSMAGTIASQSAS